MAIWQKDRLREQTQDMLRHVRHFRRMREDLLPADLLAELREREAALAQALSATAPAEPMQAAVDEAREWLGEHMPRRRFPGLRENLEILAVAVGVAMACRTYFIQPFKIPTGSMQPTLYGIQYVPGVTPTWTDRFPIKAVKWLITGEWYTEIRTTTSGYVEATYDQEDQADGKLSLIIGGKRYRVPVQSPPRLSQEEFVARGTLLWHGMRVAGDHVFVDRVRWNFQAPKRGQIIVFSTTGIPTLPPGTHYIKRLAGLPGERVSISPPNLMINDVLMDRPEGIKRIESLAPGYAGYKLVDSRTDPDPSQWALRRPEDHIVLGPDQFFALGDNTANSRDGRYWGSVPRRNLVGPAGFVYWPISRRWGFPK